ncbi:MAG: family N-acetyltransferase [Ramlibacter sp.]|jgi:RimJ/RimL family protein N-acetyltransferase|nr:family N-acetyltransferase [Ramlibacter sp.]
MSGTAASRGLEFRPLAEEDLAMLHAWVQRPHVAQWWEDPSSLEDIRHEYRPVVQGRDSTRAYVVQRGMQPIGFIQSYVVADSGDGWWPGETDPGARGIDQFLADANGLDQGTGTSMIKAFLEHLFRDPHVTVVQTDPAPHNARAIRCYEKAGFQRVGVVDTPDGPALLMRCPRP